jgi:hypothetical protein
MSEKKRKPKLKNGKIADQFELDSDENFGFIVGYTSGGAPYGLTYEEMEKMEIETEKTENQQ